MATNSGKGYRIGSVSGRSQVLNPNGHWVKRDNSTGRFVNQKADSQPFKGVRKES